MMYQRRSLPFLPPSLASISRLVARFYYYAYDAWPWIVVGIDRLEILRASRSFGRAKHEDWILRNRVGWRLQYFRIIFQNLIDYYDPNKGDALLFRNLSSKINISYLIKRDLLIILSWINLLLIIARKTKFFILVFVILRVIRNRMDDPTIQLEQLLALIIE